MINKKAQRSKQKKKESIKLVLWLTWQIQDLGQKFKELSWENVAKILTQLKIIHDMQ